MKLSHILIEIFDYYKNYIEYEEKILIDRNDNIYSFKEILEIGALNFFKTFGYEEYFFRDNKIYGCENFISEDGYEDKFQLTEYPILTIKFPDYSEYDE